MKYPDMAQITFDLQTGLRPDGRTGTCDFLENSYAWARTVRICHAYYDFGAEFRHQRAIICAHGIHEPFNCMEY